MLALKKELQTWQADCVLNDGAPNVGKSWVHDAFQQAELTLSALKLATEFLRKGGWFVTKLFRSKDYFALLWVFQQLFKHVHATKPQASRNESAEIFVVCQHYLAPAKLDPKFLDPKYVFKDVADEQPKQSINLIHPEKKQRHRDGYAEGDYTLYHRLNASEFLSSDDFMEKLASSSEIVLDTEEIANHPATTAEIKACCGDIRVLGRKEIKSLFAWRKAVLKDLNKSEKEHKTVTNGVEDVQEEEMLSESEQEEQEMQETLAKAQEEEHKQRKRKKRKERKMKSKLQQRKDMKMILPNDRLDYGDDAGVFSLSKIRSKHQLDQVQEGDLSFMDGDIVEVDDADDGATVRKKRKLTELYDKDSKDYLDRSEISSDEEGEEEPEFDDDDVAASFSQQSRETSDNNPLVVELDTKDNKVRNRTASWFSKEVFDDLEKDDDEDVEIEAMTVDYQERGGTIVGKADSTPGKKRVHFADDVEDKESDSDYDVEDLIETKSKPVTEPAKHKLDKKAGFEVARAESDVQTLDPEGLAIGAAMVCSKKRRREIIENAYHKYMFNDDSLPDWFAKDESRHCKKQLPVTKEEVQEYMLKARAVDARPIKKIAEAKARKKKKLVKRLEKARKKAEKVTEEEGVSEREKMQQVKQIYKKAGLLSKKKQEVTYVVAKKGMGKRVRRPHGVSGHFKVVDPRMKKDMRSNKAAKGNKTKGKTSNKKQRKKGKGG
nr:hypothetical protein BaRGS_015398 [Batillaria attramentaria]